MWGWACGCQDILSFSLRMGRVMMDNDWKAGQYVWWEHEMAMRVRIQKFLCRHGSRLLMM